MIVGIVGSEAAKFTESGKRKALIAIREILRSNQATGVSSGHCHLGGIDIWAEDAADEAGIVKHIYPPKYLTWAYYKARNIQIAEKSDIVYCLSVDVLPPDYTGMRFNSCYHHCDDRDSQPHVKSGGCWTTKYARKLGKPGQLIVIPNG